MSIFPDDDQGQYARSGALKRVGLFIDEIEERVGNLTPLEHIRLDYLPPPESLQGLVTTFYWFRCDEIDIRDIQPASGGFVMLFLSGQGQMHFPDGHTDQSHPVSLLTPCRTAVQFEVAGPFHCFGAAMSPLGWAALTGLAANRWGDRMLDATEFLGSDAAALGELLCNGYTESTFDSGAAVSVLASFIAARLRPINPRHSRFMGQVAAFLGTSLSPPLEALHAEVGYSTRQIQRLAERYFGAHPSELVRRYRALRAVALLSDPDISVEAEAAVIDSFYDQSHMIREIRLFAGRTPARLAESDTPILNALLDLRNFRELTPNVAALPDIASAKNSA